MQPFTNLNKRLVGAQEVTHKFDKKIKKAEKKKEKEELKVANNPGG